jgi:hypothetical protein
MRAVRRGLSEIQLGWLEAWPNIDFNEMSSFLERLASREALPDYWRLDIDWNTASKWKKDPKNVIGDARRLAEQHGITFVLFVNSTEDPIPTEAQHHRNLVALAKRIYELAPDVPQLCIGSFATRTRCVGQRLQIK